VSAPAPLRAAAGQQILPARLQPKSSLLRWLVEQGHTVFVISWINPGAELADMGMADYIKLGPIAALDAIEQRPASGRSTCSASAWAARSRRWRRLTWPAAARASDRVRHHHRFLLDFAELGQWATFTDPSSCRRSSGTWSIAASWPRRICRRCSARCAPNDLIWSSVVSHYLLDKEAPPSDILYWFADGAHIPRAFLLEYTTQLLRDNKLREAGGVTIDGVPLDLGAIEAPLTAISLKEDHVSAWAATYESARLWGGPKTFLLGGSGHNAGVINPPSATSTASGRTRACPTPPRLGSRARPAAKAAGGRTGRPGWRATRSKCPRGCPVTASSRRSNRPPAAMCA
jgi:polyhydroxyalkanoate synthase